MKEKAMFKLLRWAPLFILVILIFLIYYFHWNEYLTFNTLSKYHQQLSLWTQKNYYSTVFIFTLTYIITVATSIPGGSTILTITAGFLFGVIPSAIYVVFGATFGASIVFIAIKTVLGTWLSNKAKGWAKRVEKRFKHNAFNYLLFLRLVPIFPFWTINIVAALLNIRFKVFFFATLLGIIPGTVVYSSIGNGLGAVFEKKIPPDFFIILEPKILIPILALAVLSVLPVIYKKLKAKKIS